MDTHTLCIIITAQYYHKRKELTEATWETEESGRQ